MSNRELLHGEAIPISRYLFGAHYGLYHGEALIQANSMTFA